MRRAVALVTLVGVSMDPALAVAQGECPPGGWFCEEVPPANELDVEPSAEVVANVAEDPAGTAASAGGEPPPPQPPSPPPPTPAPLPAVRVLDGAPPPPEPATRAGEGVWGIPLRLDLALLGRDPERADEAGMAGLGFGLRLRPIPHFAFEAGLDFFGGRDWQGERRQETSMAFDGIVFFNPDDPVQVYLLGGFGWSVAAVRDLRVELIDGESLVTVQTLEYTYFGGRLGAGLEFRVGERTAIDLDWVGFARGRTDALAEREPEFVDPQDPRRTTNVSGGGLMRCGVTFYW